MKFNQIPTNVFKTIQTGAGLICRQFNIFTGEVTGIIGATSGGLNISIVPSTKDYGEDIDNVKKNTFQLKKIEEYEAKMSGTFVSVSKETIRQLIGATIDTTETPSSGTSSPVYSSVSRYTPDSEYSTDDSNNDFETLWWVGDYTDDNNSTSGKYLAVRMDNCINTSGFNLKTTDKEKGQFSFEFLAHYSLNSGALPFSVFVVENEST